MSSSDAGEKSAAPPTKIMGVPDATLKPMILMGYRVDGLGRVHR